ncbi:membrane metallo-endopeptidase-like 1 [Dermacentor variabilis]|uniref:membrane metallo-endopeptidase-like 1 n=1 Tax=Dermacentor variabilis TaxID=34621 RepID=UPI003F5CA3D5
MEKIRGITTKIAYPSWLLDTNSLEEMYSDVTDFQSSYSFVKLMHKITENNQKRMLKKLRTAYSEDFDSFFGQSTATTFYSPRGNEIVSHARGLRTPFYEFGLPKSVNFGSIGAVIAHEISHSFIGSGGYYDAKGRLQYWWTTQSAEKFKETAECIKMQYGRVFDDKANMTLDGVKTLEENIADSIGLNIAFKAYHNLLSECDRPAARLEGLEGFSGAQLFLLSYAMMWCEVTTPDQIRLKIQRMPQSPNKYRVNLPVRNLDAFPSPFNCQRIPSDDSPSNNKCVIL